MKADIIIVMIGVFLLGLSIGILVNLNTGESCSLTCSVPDPTWDPTLGNFLLPEAEGYHIGTIVSTDEESQMVWLILMHVLEEEEKQTRLLDHMDCIQTAQIFYYPKTRDCLPIPLNMTGIWKP